MQVSKSNLEISNQTFNIIYHRNKQLYLKINLEAQKASDSQSNPQKKNNAYFKSHCSHCDKQYGLRQKQTDPQSRNQM